MGYCGNIQATPPPLIQPSLYATFFHPPLSQVKINLLHKKSPIPLCSKYLSPSSALPADIFPMQSLSKFPYSGLCHVTQSPEKSGKAPCTLCHRAEAHYHYAYSLAESQARLCGYHYIMVVCRTGSKCSPREHPS